jgi:hypothetical protein
MKKTVSQSRNPFTTTQITSRRDAIAAFARGDVLSKEERKKVMTDHFKSRDRMSLKKAFVIALKYGIGLISEEKVKLYALTSAWIRLGEEKWQTIVTTAQKITEGFQVDWWSFLRKFCQMIQKILTHHKPDWAW